MDVGGSLALSSGHRAPWTISGCRSCGPRDLHNFSRYTAIKYATFTETTSSDYLWYRLCQTSMVWPLYMKKKSYFWTISLLISKRLQSHAERFFILRFWRHGDEWDCDVIADVHNSWSECIPPIGSDIYVWNVHFDWGLILSYFLKHCTFHKNIERHTEHTIVSWPMLHV